MNRIELLDRIDASHRDTPIRRAACCEPPSNREVKRLVQEAKSLLLPGFYGDGIPETGNRSKTARILFRFRRRLVRQVEKVLCRDEETDRRRARSQARDRADAFLLAIPRLRAYLQTDLDAHYEGDPAAVDRDMVALAYPGFYAVVVHRIAHELALLGVPFLPRMMAEFAHRETGIDIHPGATIGPHFMIDHGTGVVIGETAVIGANVRIFQGVTLGALTTKGGHRLSGVRRHPTIGDDVTIYAGASILGGDTVVGAAATIGSNAFVTASVAPGARVSMKDAASARPCGKEEPDDANP